MQNPTDPKILIIEETQNLKTEMDSQIVRLALIKTITVITEAKIKNNLVLKDFRPNPEFTNYLTPYY